MIHIIQLLCPLRHAIIGCAFDPEEYSFEEVKASATKELAKLKANPWCGICGSHDLRFEEGRTKFKTMAEAMPSVAQIGLHQMLTRALLEKEGRTYDSQRQGKN